MDNVPSTFEDALYSPDAVIVISLLGEIVSASVVINNKRVCSDGFIVKDPED
jgi:hypothetical protein